MNDNSATIARIAGSYVDKSTATALRVNGFATLTGYGKRGEGMTGKEASAAIIAARVTADIPDVTPARLAELVKSPAYMAGATATNVGHYCRAYALAVLARIITPGDKLGANVAVAAYRLASNAAQAGTDLATEVGTDDTLADVKAREDAFIASAASVMSHGDKPTATDSEGDSEDGEGKGKGDKSLADKLTAGIARLAKSITSEDTFTPAELATITAAIATLSESVNRAPSADKRGTYPGAKPSPANRNRGKRAAVIGSIA